MNRRHGADAIFALLFLAACSHPLMREDDGGLEMLPSPSPAAIAKKTEAAPQATPLPTYPFDTDQVRFVLDETVWKKISDASGIQAYERREGKNPYGDVVAFRGETVMPVKLTKIATILNTPGLQHEWVDSLEDARIVEQISKFESIGYNRTGVPWPFQDRDFVYRVKVQVQKDPPLMLIHMKSVDDPRVAPMNGVVRGEMLISYFYMKELSDRQTQVVIEMAVDPKGAIPLWLVNSAQKKWPSNTLRKLRELAMRESIPVSKEIEEYFQKSQTKRGKKK